MQLTAPVADTQRGKSLEGNVLLRGWCPLRPSASHSREQAYGVERRNSLLFVADLWR
jgi:hypothetical protein